MILQTCISKDKLFILILSSQVYNYTTMFAYFFVGRVDSISMNRSH